MIDELLDQKPLKLERWSNHQERYKDIKDPSIIRMPGRGYEMFASIGNSSNEIWKVGHFKADKLDGPWKELPPVTFHTPAGLEHNLDGLNCCAPAVLLEQDQGKLRYKMYIQTTCFQEKGVIAVATSNDGTHFTALPETVATVKSCKEKPLVNVYDVGVSEMIYKGEPIIHTVFTGCTKTGCGDLYAATRPKNGTDKDWTPGKLLLDQAEVAFHNQPHMPHFEWGLEAGQVVQLDKNLYLLAAVCFLEKEGKEHNGTRQRIFFAASRSPTGDFKPMGVAVDAAQGENGHPDMIVSDGKLHLIYQDREGDKKPWKLSYGNFDLEKLRAKAAQHLDSLANSELWAGKDIIGRKNGSWGMAHT